MSEVSFVLSCPTGDCPTTIYGYNLDYSEMYFYMSYASFTEQVDSYCIPIGECTQFIVYDDSGLEFTNVEFQVSIDGNEVLSQSGFQYSYYGYVNCPEGSLCGAPILISGDGTYTTTSDDTWYLFTPATTGLFHASTCDLNTCDTKIWV